MIVLLRQLLAAILSLALAAPALCNSANPVGNRTQKVSTLPGYPRGSSNYNANDQLGTDTYDNDGNTTASNGLGYVYDFENHLVQQSGISIVYDGDGNRVSKTVAGVTTAYLVADDNPTGYPQVIGETISGASPPAYVYGLELISRSQTVFTPGAAPFGFKGAVFDFPLQCFPHHPRLFASSTLSIRISPFSPFA